MANIGKRSVAFFRRVRGVWSRMGLPVIEIDYTSREVFLFVTTQFFYFLSVFRYRNHFCLHHAKIFVYYFAVVIL